MIEITNEKIVKAINQVAATDEGRIILAYIRDWCGHGKSKVAVRLEDTYANASVERLYLSLREHIRDEHLKEIEFNYKRKAVENDGHSSKRGTKRKSGDKRSTKRDNE